MLGDIGGRAAVFAADGEALDQAQGIAADLKVTEESEVGQALAELVSALGEDPGEMGARAVSGEEREQALDSAAALIQSHERARQARRRG